MTDSKAKANLLRASLILAAVCTSGVERLGDFNGDGKADLLLRHSDGSWRYHAGDGASTAPGEPLRITTELSWYWAGAGDFNGDGRDDIMLRREDGVWLYYPLDGSRVIVEERGWANLTRNLDFRVVGVGDFNADGRDDILMRRSGGAWAYYPMNGRRVIRADAGWANLPRDVGWRMAGVGDFNGDGRPEVLLRHIDGTWRHYAMDGRRTVPDESATALLPGDLSWRLAGIGDLDGDGGDNVLLRHANGRWRHETVAGTGASVSLSRDWAWRLAAVDDVDGDGRDDVVLRHHDGRWLWKRTVVHGDARPAALDWPRGRQWQTPARPAYIPDPALRRTLEEALGKANGELMRPRELALLTVLNRQRAGIADLTGIESAVGLTRLWLRFSAIRSLRPLFGLVELRSLDLPGNKIRDVSPLAHLPKLEALWLDDNEIEDISPLRTLSQLQVLDVDKNRVDDISPVEDIAGLVSLNLDHNHVSDLTPAAGLTALKTLTVCDNAVEDITALTRLTRLEYVCLSGNRIADFRPLSGLAKLEWLALDSTGIEDLSPLAGLTALSDLRLQENGIEDISPLAGLTRLARLSLGNNNVSDISAVRRLTRLDALYLPFNAVSDLTPLANLTRLEVLGLYQNNVEDISTLSGLTNLWALTLSHNRIADLSPLAELTSLRRLSLIDAGVQDLTPLRGLTALETLLLQDNQIDDISALADLTLLQALDLSRNLIVDITPLQNLTNLNSLRLAYNQIRDLTPLTGNAGLDADDILDVRGNPLTDESWDTVVPLLIARGVRVEVGTRVRFELVHDDTVVVLHVAENLAMQDLFTGLPLELYSTTLYSRFQDSFDFIMFFSNLDDIDEHEHAHYYGVYSSVRNDTAGVGLRTFYDNRYGSAETLKGVIHFPYNRALRSGPSLHEMQHAWANYTIPTAVGGHWGFSSANGQLGGFETGNLVELGDNRYAAGRFGTFANGGNRPAYSPIELYFAGYIPPEEVPDLWVAADGEWVVEDGDLVRTEDGHGIFTASDVRTYSIEDVVATAGPRTPSMADAQWDFRVAVVLLTDDDHPATDEQLDLLSDHAAWFSLPARDDSDLHNFFEATGGRGTVTMDGLSQLQDAIPAAATGLPASFGVAPEPRVTLLDGRCLPLSAARTSVGSGVDPDAGAQGRLFIGET